MTAEKPSFPQRMFRSRWLRWSILAIAACCGSYAFNEWTWERKWQAYVEESRARGVKLYIADFLPKEPIPDEENFAATPIWREIFARGNDTGPIASKLKAIRQPGSKAGSDSSRLRPARVDLAAWRASMVDAKKLTAADAALSDGAAVLRGLEFLKPELDEIRASVKRAKVRFPVKWEDGFAASMPHLSSIQALARIFQLTATARLSEGDATGAYEDWKTTWDLAEKLEAEPSFLGFLVHLAVLDTTIATVREGIETHRWTSDQLEAIQNLIGTPNLIHRLVLAFSSERAWLNTSLKPFIDRQRSFSDLTGGSGVTIGNIGETLLTIRSLSRSWWRKNQLWMNRASDEELTMWNAEAEVARPHPREFNADAITGFWEKIDLGLVLLSSPVYGSFEKRALHSHATLRMARLACALERFRIANARYPERLEELTPRFIEKFPHDPCDGQAFRYRVTPEGYLLYSIGTDLKDDNGKVTEIRSPHQGPDWRWWSPER